MIRLFMLRLLFAKVAEILKAIDSGFVTIAPAKIEGVPPDDRKVFDFDCVRN